MTSSPQRFVVVVLAALAMLSLAAPPSALAGAGEGTAVLALDGPGGERLARSGLRLRAADGAAAFRGRVALPVVAVRSRRGLPVSLRLGGTVTLIAARRDRRPLSLTLRALRLRLGPAARLTALTGGRRLVVVVAVARQRWFDRRTGSIRLERLDIRLTARSAGLLRRVLGVPASGGSRIGSLSLDAILGSKNAPGSAAPARPPSAVEVTSASLGWHVRDSFVQYINAGEGIEPFGGARAGPATVRPGSDRPLRYDFDLPFAHGWYDERRRIAVLWFSGGLRFGYRAHGIDLRAAAARVEIIGARRAGSRATFVLRGRAGTRLRGRRQTLMDLRPDGAASSPDGRTHSFGRIPATVPAGAQTSVFAGFYRPGDEFGWVSLSFSVRQREPTRRTPPP